MYKRAILIFLLLSISFSSQSVRAQEITGTAYVVKPGDTLSSIAASFNVTLTALMSANGITDPNQIDVGQQLIIPGIVIINMGDSYRNLIRRMQVSQSSFNKLNHIVSPGQFYIGANMILPSEGVTQTLNTGISPKPGESLLELAVKQNTDVWTLSHNNHLEGSWDGVPGDTLFAQGKYGEQSASGLPSAIVSAEIRDLPLKQGGTGVIIVHTVPNVTLGGLLVDHPLHFFTLEDGTQIALQGVHAQLEPGIYPLRLDATLQDGSKQSYEQFILIVSGNYLEEVIQGIDPAFIDPAVTEPELQEVMQITLPANPTKYWSGEFISPAIAYADSTYFTSRYGTRRTYTAQGSDLNITGAFHTGLDFGGGNGLALTAPAAGVIVFAGPLTVRGNATIIDHGWGVYSGFWHQSKIQVQVGQLVQQNEVIGLVGGTGRVTGAHLHWELWVNGIQVDPLDWLIQTYP